MAEILVGEALFPKDHPYHWPVIGYMEDLSAASDDDVRNFFRTWYGPANASLVLAGDIDVATARALAEKWFGEVPTGPKPAPPVARPVILSEEKRLVHEDRVDLPRLVLAWVTPPVFSPADAALDVAAGVLATGKNSRLYRKLVYEKEVAQDVGLPELGGARVHLRDRRDGAEGPRPRGDPRAGRRGDCATRGGTAHSAGGRTASGTSSSRRPSPASSAWRHLRGGRIFSTTSTSTRGIPASSKGISPAIAP